MGRAGFSEEDIQSEIRKRILREADRKDGKETAEEATQATLDALEGMVSLSREKMEKIAEEVRAEYEARNREAESLSSSWLYPFGALLLVVITFFLVRRGSAWYLFTGLILLVVALNYMLRRSADKENNNDKRNKDV